MITRRACLGLFGSLMMAAPRFARAAPVVTKKKAAVVSIFFEGGFNALFGSADSFQGNNAFGVTSTNIRDVGNGLFVDASSIGMLGDYALKHIAAIGNRHGATDHVSAQQNNFTDGAMSYPTALANAIGGSASFKAVGLGSLPAKSQHQLLRTMGDVTTALGLGTQDPSKPTRDRAAAALAQSKAMSSTSLTKNKDSMAFARDGYDTVVDSLSKPPPSLDVQKITQAYGTNPSAGLDNFASKLAAAELMIRGGTNVATIGSTGWDTHGDRTGATARRRMTAEVIPSLKTFLARTQSDPDLAQLNITVMLHGDFARSLPASDHAPSLSALVIGPNVKVGTTGRVSPNVTLPTNTGSSKQMWSYVAALAKADGDPFGPNPHALVL